MVRTNKKHDSTKVLLALTAVINAGWPSKIEKVITHLREYWNFRDGTYSPQWYCIPWKSTSCTKVYEV